MFWTLLSKCYTSFSNNQALEVIFTFPFSSLIMWLNSCLSTTRLPSIDVMISHPTAIALTQRKINLLKKNGSALLVHTLRGRGNNTQKCWDLQAKMWIIYLKKKFTHLNIHLAVSMSSAVTSRTVIPAAWHFRIASRTSGLTKVACSSFKNKTFCLSKYTNNSSSGPGLLRSIKN